MTSLVYQNAIDAPNPSVWTPFTTTITASTTAPTVPPTSRITSYYLQFGPTLRISMNYVQFQTTGATAGSGNYIFNLPPGFTADTTVVPALSTATSLITSCLGTFSTCVGGQNNTDGTNINTTRYGAAILYDSTHYCGSSQNNINSNYPWGYLVGAGGNFVFSVTANNFTTYSAMLIIPIVF